MSTSPEVVSSEQTEVVEPVRRGRGRPMCFTQAVQLEIVKDIQERNKTAKKVAEERGVSYITILRTLRAHGVKIRAKTPVAV